MKFGIITLVSDNYGNKYQNYAVEQLLSQYGQVETFGLENLYQAPATAEASVWKKLSPGYIREVLISRPMYRYDINCVDKGIIHNLIYAYRNKNQLLKLKQKRSQAFGAFVKKNLHISDKTLNRNNTDADWSGQYDYFVCGSDQIWNPGYGTTSELAFCSFAPKKTVCLAPSFGVSEVPDYRCEDYQKWLNNIYKLSVREDAGQKIIKDLTGREAEVLLDPTMAIPVKIWDGLCKRPENNLPDRYIACYFLGRIEKNYRRKIEAFAKQQKLPVVMLFDITTPEYYTYDPAEVLYTIKHAEYVLTDSFHGSVFSILFHKAFYVFQRDEGGRSLNSRLETLLRKFGLDDSVYQTEGGYPSCDWEKIDSILESERVKTNNYLSDAIGMGSN